jgi:hypothetical protein
MEEDKPANYLGRQQFSFYYEHLLLLHHSKDNLYMCSFAVAF